MDKIIEIKKLALTFANIDSFVKYKYFTMTFYDEVTLCA